MSRRVLKKLLSIIMVAIICLPIGTELAGVDAKAATTASATDSAVTDMNMGSEDIVGYIEDCVKQGKYEISFTSDMAYDALESAVNKGIASPWNIVDQSSLSNENNIYTLKLYSNDYTSAQLQSMNKELKTKLKKSLQK